MKRSDQRLIIFDLDETLVHTTEKRLEGRIEDARYKDCYIYKRPSLDDFLIECSLSYRVAIWSSAEDDYVRGVVSAIISADLQLEFVWGRSDCWIKVVRVKDESGISFKQNVYIKPLEKIRRKGYRTEQLLIIDDTPQKVIDNKGKYLIINPFEGNPDDRELHRLAAYLRDSVDEENFSNMANDHWRNHY